MSSPSSFVHSFKNVHHYTVTHHKRMLKSNGRRVSGLQVEAQKKHIKASAPFVGTCLRYAETLMQLVRKVTKKYDVTVGDESIYNNNPRVWRESVEALYKLAMQLWVEADAYISITFEMKKESNGAEMLKTIREDFLNEKLHADNSVITREFHTEYLTYEEYVSLFCPA